MATGGLAAVLSLVMAALPAIAAGSRGVGVQVTANPLAVELRLSTRDLPVGSSFTAFVTATNLGTTALTKARYLLLLDGSGLKASGPDGGESTLDPNRRSTATFSVCATRPGSYILIGSASAQTRSRATFTTSTPGQLLVVRQSTARPKCR